MCKEWLIVNCDPLFSAVRERNLNTRSTQMDAERNLIADDVSQEVMQARAKEFDNITPSPEQLERCDQVLNGTSDFETDDMRILSSPSLSSHQSEILGASIFVGAVSVQVSYLKSDISLMKTMLESIASRGDFNWDCRNSRISTRNYRCFQ